MSPELATMSSVLNRQQSIVQMVSDNMEDEFNDDDDEDEDEEGGLLLVVTDINNGDNNNYIYLRNLCGSKYKLSAKLDVNKKGVDGKVSIVDEDWREGVEAKQKSDKKEQKVMALSLGIPILFLVIIVAAYILHQPFLVYRLLILFNIWSFCMSLFWVYCYYHDGIGRCMSDNACTKK